MSFKNFYCLLLVIALLCNFEAVAIAQEGGQSPPQDNSINRTVKGIVKDTSPRERAVVV